MLRDISSPRQVGTQKIVVKAQGGNDLQRTDSDCILQREHQLRLRE